MEKYVICVGNGYGCFFFDGTEADAEDMRKHKAEWEGGPAKKRLASEEEIAQGYPSQNWNYVIDNPTP